MNTIFTHAGYFHADDVFACAICRMAGFGPNIVRLQKVDKVMMAEGDIVVDVGGMFDPSCNLFDHHFTFGSDDGFASTGKIWRHVGYKICGSPEVSNKVYHALLGSIDRADIGLKDWAPIRRDWNHISGSYLIHLMNPENGLHTNEAFELAVQLAELVLKNCIEKTRKILKMKKLISSSVKIYEKILILKEAGPWQEIIISDRMYDDLLFVVFPSERGGWYVQCIPKELESFEVRKSLRNEWWGKRETELVDLLSKTSNLTFINTSSLFVHPNGFIGGAQTVEEAILLATFSLV